MRGLRRLGLGRGGVAVTIPPIVVDVTPNAFAFTDQTNVAVGSTRTSNTITVSGLSTGANVAVTVTGGTYSKNGGAASSIATTAQNGDQFSVSHPASGSGSTAVNTILTIGGVSDTFTSTTVAGAVATNSVAPDLTGTPRDGQPYWLYAGEWSVGTNYYRFIMKRDGSTFRTVTQSDDVITGTWAATEVGKIITGTVEGSLDGGATYSAPVAVDLLFPFFSDMITPATIAAPVLTRTSASGVTPMTFTVSGSPYSSYLMEMRYKEADTDLIGVYRKAFAEADLITPFTPDWSGETDPVPDIIPPALGATDYVEMRFISADYYANADDSVVYEGVASSWSNSISPTDALVPVRWNSADKSPNVLLSSSDMVAEVFGNPGVPYLVRANQGVGSGQLRYFEIEIIDEYVSFLSLVDDVPPITDEWLPAGEGGTPTVHAINWQYTGTIAFNTGYPHSGAGSHVTGSICGFYVNGITDRLYLTHNGTATIGDRVAGTGGIDISTLDFPMKPGAILGPSSEARLRAKAADLIYAPDNGYTPLDPA